MGSSILRMQWWLVTDDSVGRVWLRKGNSYANSMLMSIFETLGFLIHKNNVLLRKVRKRKISWVDYRLRCTTSLWIGIRRWRNWNSSGPTLDFDSTIWAAEIELSSNRNEIGDHSQAGPRCVHKSDCVMGRLEDSAVWYWQHSPGQQRAFRKQCSRGFRVTMVAQRRSVPSTNNAANAWN